MGDVAVVDVTPINGIVCKCRLVEKHVLVKAHPTLKENQIENMGTNLQKGLKAYEHRCCLVSQGLNCLVDSSFLHMQ